MSRDSITVWRLMAHHEYPDEALRWTTQNARIAIGWGAIGDIRVAGFASAGEIADAIHVEYPALKNSGSGGVCLYDFCFNMEKGDLVIVNAKGIRRMVVEVDGDYTFKPPGTAKAKEEYEHQRSAKVQSIDPDELWREVGGELHEGYSIRWTLIKCAKTIDSMAKERLLSHGG